MLVCCSAVIHLAVYLFLLYFHIPTHFKEAPVYYVDLLNLPVANPQAGAPGAVQTAHAPPRQPQPREMTLPAKAPVRQTAAIPPKQPDATETAREFEERIGLMRQKAEADHAAKAIEASKTKVNSKAATGMPGAMGNEPGSDYAGYVRSRLEDAFRHEDTFKPDPGKMAIVRLTIDRNGRIISQRYEQRSNDRIFDDAVARAIARAEKEFTRPPGGGQFEYGFVFKPQGVGKR